MGQREYLQECCNRYGDFKVAKAWKDKNGNIIWTKWKSVMECWHSEEGLKFLDVVNNRTIFPCEMILDIDKEPIEDKLHEITKYLKEEKISFKAYFTGSKGYHIHIIFYALLTENDKNNIRKHLIKKFDCDMAKSSDNVMIALENVPHWKTGRIKSLIEIN